MKSIFRKQGILRLVTLSAVISILFLLTSPSTFDAVFILFLESLVICLLVFFMSFLAKDFLDGFMQVLVSIFVIPIMLFFVGCGFLLFLLIYSGGPDTEMSSQDLLIQNSWLLMDEPVAAFVNIIRYFGNDFYYICGGILLYHIIAILALKFGKTKSDQLWFDLKKQFMLQCLALLMGALLLSIPMTIAIAAFESSPWLTFVSVIGLRILVEIWKLYLESGKEVKAA